MAVTAAPQRDPGNGGNGGNGTAGGLRRNGRHGRHGRRNGNGWNADVRRYGWRRHGGMGGMSTATSSLVTSWKQLSRKEVDVDLVTMLGMPGEALRVPAPSGGARFTDAVCAAFEYHGRTTALPRPVRGRRGSSQRCQRIRTPAPDSRCCRWACSNKPTRRCC